MIKHQIKSDTKYSVAYETYFKMRIGDQDISRAPHFICRSCRTSLVCWLRGSRKSMQFALPRIQREPTNHLFDCYFCLVNISKAKCTKGRKNVEYPNIPSSIAPVSHSSEFPIPNPPSKMHANQDIDNSRNNEDMSRLNSLISQLKVN